ncbi:hypothetical protein VNO78_11442 [Psophocarpus tetragonolobus]|uniref:Uncharacterized protein n=1 Tax=Psophocarpus tetragonolobus TaxID=3891 RepID=A0AAN9XNF9_PSOTE
MSQRTRVSHDNNECSVVRMSMMSLTTRTPLGNLPVRSRYRRLGEVTEEVKVEKGPVEGDFRRKSLVDRVVGEDNICEVQIRVVQQWKRRDVGASIGGEHQ